MKTKHSCSAIRASRTKSLFVKLLAAALLGLPLMGNSAYAQTKGAGSSLARDLMARWVTDFGKGGVVYNPVGSTAGVQQISEKTVDFAVTDRPMAAVQLDRLSLRQYPLAASAVSIVANLPGLPKDRSLKLTGGVLADIYSGTITNWNDRLIKVLNPDLELPNLAITPVYRADGSGQTYALTLFLSRNSQTWSRRFGSNEKIAFPAGEAKSGGAALLAAVKAKPGAIGYDVLGEGLKSGLVLPQLQNASAKYVSPSVAAVSEAIAQATWDTTSATFVPTNAADLDGSAGDKVWPISVVTYALVPAQDKAGAMAFLSASIAQGDKGVSDNSFVPIPTNMKAVVQKAAGK
jgi:phosphate transport system substrate-binding protein